MLDRWERLIYCILIVVSSALGGLDSKTAMEQHKKNQQLQEDAVRRGYAVWVIDTASGQLKFQWRPDEHDFSRRPRRALD